MMSYVAMTFRQMNFVAVNYGQDDEFSRQSPFIDISPLIILLYYIDELIPSSKNSARFILNTNNAIFRPIP